MTIKERIRRQRRWNRLSTIEQLADRLAIWRKPKKVTLCIVHGEEGEVVEAEFNDFVLKLDGTLELWYNEGYEI